MSESLGIPVWLGDLSLPGAIVLFGLALARGWLSTSGQVNRLMDSARLVSELWEKVATERQETIKVLSESIGPVLEGQAAILTRLDELQRSQSLPVRGGRRV